MSNTADFPALALVEREAPATGNAAPEAPAAAPAHAVGRRWSDGAGSFAPADPNAPWSMAQQWPNLVAALSEQAVESSNLLLRALNYLVGAGRLRRSEAKALSDAMHQLRATSLRAQQITRLASGRIRQARERVDLAELVRHVLEERNTDIVAAAASVSADLQPVDVLLDPPVAISLLNAIVDWGLSFSKDIALVLVPADWPGPAQLKVRVKTPPPASCNASGWATRPRGRRLNDGLHWMMLRQIAASSGLAVTRSREEGGALLAIDFPKTFLSTEGVSCLELNDADDQAAPLRDTWVLVIARDDAVRAEAADALRKMGIAAMAASDTVNARTVIADKRPNVLVTAWDVQPEEIAAFRQEVLGGEERCPLVEITRELPSFHLSGFDRFETPKVGREQLTAELPPTVLFELVKIV
jgi:hypothetical protein